MTTVLGAVKINTEEKIGERFIADDLGYIWTWEFGILKVNGDDSPDGGHHFDTWGEAVQFLLVEGYIDGVKVKNGA